MEFPTVGENDYSLANTTFCVQNPQLSGKMIYGNPSCSRKITIHQRISTLGIQDTINHSSANANCGCTEFPTVGEHDQWRLTFSVRKSLLEKNNHSSANINIEDTESPIVGENDHLSANTNIRCTEFPTAGNQISVIQLIGSFANSCGVRNSFSVTLEPCRTGARAEAEAVVTG